jgi:hypothetical protein
MRVVVSLQQKIKNKNLEQFAKFCKKKKLFVNATFLLALAARPYPLPLKQNPFWLVAANILAVGQVDNVDNQLQVAYPNQ